MRRPHSFVRYALAAATVFLAACGGQSGRQRPNFLFLFADDQRPDTIGAWGNSHIRTPHMDRLVERGFSFRSNYNLGSSGGAVCVPSRAMVNSGLAYFRVPNNLAGVKLLPELLGENGYVTFATGKWHNERPSWRRAFQRGKAVFFGGMADHLKVPVEDLSPGGELVNQRIGEKFSSELFADAAIEFLESYQGDQPFYAYVAFTAPHDPRMPPERYRQMYYDARPPLPANFMPQHPFDNGNVGGRDENLAAWPRTREAISDQLAEYYGLITHLDEQIGRILQALEASGRAANTYVIYAADHGLAVGSHGLLGKQSIYEHSQRCPLIIVGPGVPAKGSSAALSYLLDIFPTVCSLAGVTPPPGLDGRDLAPIWRGEKPKVRDTVFLSYMNLMRSVRDDRYKLLFYPPINHTQLFDLEADPDELRNLAGDASHAPRIEQLTRQLQEWQRSLGDAQPLTVEKPQPKEIDLSGTPRKPDQWQPDWIVKKYF
ncbi:MAG: sulfatase-like hydrolase/transferase [Bryobacteraceae bacterium]|nr:sulfatase-like hydrolase/transferase [Bryobacteraceae bacterium]